VWTGKCWGYATKKDVPGAVSINTIDDSGQDILTQYEASEAPKTMGLFLAMDSNNKKETQYSREKAKEFVDHVRTGFLSCEDATYALHHTVMKILKCLMAATTMNELKWDYIMAPILKATLPHI
jgi:hypothetical protein